MAYPPGREAGRWGPLCLPLASGFRLQALALHFSAVGLGTLVKLPNSPELQLVMEHNIHPSRPPPFPSHRSLAVLEGEDNYRKGPQRVC